MKLGLLSVRSTNGWFPERDPIPPVFLPKSPRGGSQLHPEGLLPLGVHGHQDRSEERSGLRGPIG